MVLKRFLTNSTSGGSGGELAEPTIEGADRVALEYAMGLLERPGVAVQVANRLGKPIEIGLERLPGGVTRRVHDATHAAIERALGVAISTLPAAADVPTREDNGFELDPGTGKRGAIKRGTGHWSERSAWLHRLGATTVGGLGGAFGFAALAAELPISTTLMLRSIAEIAREEGEDLGEVEARIACTEVFALGGRRGSDDAADTGYFAVRSTLARAMATASRQVANKGLTTTATRHMPSVTKLVSAISQRFSTSVTEKFAAQSVPLLGAAGGATVNYVFMNHFQHMARGHFIVRRLERVYGKALVEAEYEKVRLSDHTAREPEHPRT